MSLKYEPASEPLHSSVKWLHAPLRQMMRPATSVAVMPWIAMLSTATNRSSACTWQRSYLTQGIFYRVLQSQLPHTIVNLLFDDLFDDFRLTICWKVDFLKPLG